MPQSDLGGAILVVGWKGIGRRTLVAALLQHVRSRLRMLRLSWSEISNENCLSRRKTQRKLVQCFGLSSVPEMKALDVYDLMDDYKQVALWAREAIPEISAIISNHIMVFDWFMMVVDDVQGHMDREQLEEIGFFTPGKLPLKLKNDWKQWSRIGVPGPAEWEKWRKTGIGLLTEDKLLQHAREMKNATPMIPVEVQKSRQTPIAFWLISSPSREFCSGMMMKPDHILEYEDMELIPAWELICFEASEAARSLSISGIGTVAVLECFFYSLLFSYHHDAGVTAGNLDEGTLVRHWLAEGLITSDSGGVHVEGDEEEEGEAAEIKTSALFAKGKDLLQELLSRSMLERHPLPTGLDCIGVAEHVRQRASEMVSRDSDDIIKSPLHSQISKFLLSKEDGGRQPAPPSEWGEAKRISLINQGIGELSKEPPACSTLSTIILRGNSQLHDIPINFFQHMASLRVVDLSFTSITSTTSLTILPNVTMLSFLGCEFLEKIDLAGNPSLRFFLLSKSPVTQLSLRGCTKLEAVDLYDLPNLKELDLSDSGIREFPARVVGPSSSPRLRRVDLLRTKLLRRFPWQQLECLPPEVNIDQCSFGSDNLTGNTGASIYVGDSRFFLGLNDSAGEKLLGVTNYPGRFHVFVSPCGYRKFQQKYAEIDGRISPSNINNDAVTVITKKLLQFTQNESFCYKSMCSRLVETARTMSPPYLPLDRHLEIEGGNRFPDGLTSLIDYMESISLSDNQFVESLTDMNDQFGILRECRVQQCHHMTAIFAKAKQTQNTQLQNTQLELLWICDLRKLSRVCWISENWFTWDLFRSLKHVHLERCPMLVSVFPHNLTLPSLETLTIRFCSNLEEVFYVVPEAYRHNHRKLHTVNLLELPKMKYFGWHHRSFPALKVLRVRGCWRLRQLPSIGKEVVEVSGEEKWWNNMSWDQNSSDKNKYRFRPQPSFFTAKPQTRGRSRRRRISGSI